MPHHADLLPELGELANNPVLIEGQQGLVLDVDALFADLPKEGDRLWWRREDHPDKPLLSGVVDAVCPPTSGPRLYWVHCDSGGWQHVSQLDVVPAPAKESLS